MMLAMRMDVVSLRWTLCVYVYQADCMAISAATREKKGEFNNLAVLVVAAA